LFRLEKKTRRLDLFSHQHPSTRTQIWVLSLLTIVYIFGFIDRVVIQTVVEPIKKDLSLTDLQLGLIGGLSFAVLHATLSIPIARMAERRSRNVIISIGVVLWSIATMACGAAGSFVSLFAARVGVGIGEAAGLPAATSLLSDYFPRHRRASAMSIYTLAVPLGALAGGVLGGIIGQAFGWRTAFVAVGAPGGLLAALLYWTIREPIRGGFDPQSVRDEVPPLSSVFSRFVRIASLRYLVIGTTLATTGGYGINYFLAAYLGRRFGFDVAHAGITTGIVSSIPGLVGIGLSGFIADKLGRKSPRAYAIVPGIALIIACALYTFAFSQMIPTPFLALIMATSLVQFMYIPTTNAVVQNMMAPRMRASASAVLNLFYSLIGLGIGPLLIGWLSDRFAASGYSGGQMAYAHCGSIPKQLACAEAAADGLQQAMTAFSLFYLVGGAIVLLSSRTLPQDLRDHEGAL